MQPQEFMDFVHILEGLKCRTCHSYTSTLRHESVAEHTFRIAAMALLLEGEFPGLDMAKVIKMCLVHDWGEAVTGDIPSFLKTDGDEEREAEEAAAAEDFAAYDVEYQLIDDGALRLDRAGLAAYAHGEYFALGKKLGDFGFSVRKKKRIKRGK